MNQCARGRPPQLGKTGTLDRQPPTAITVASLIADVACQLRAEHSMSSRWVAQLLVLSCCLGCGTYQVRYVRGAFHGAELPAPARDLAVCLAPIRLLVGPQTYFFGNVQEFVDQEGASMRASLRAARVRLQRAGANCCDVTLHVRPNVTSDTRLDLSWYSAPGSFWYEVGGERIGAGWTYRVPRSKVPDAEAVDATWITMGVTRTLPLLHLPTSHCSEDETDRGS
jgi:hypothetical protein